MSDSKIEKALRDVVRAQFQKDGFTVNIARNAVVQKLELKEDFFQAEEWKLKSKKIIHEQVDLCHNGDPSASEPSASNEKRTSLKRASPAPESRPRKKSKTVEDDDELSDDLTEEDKPTKTSKSRQSSKPKPVSKPQKPSKKKPDSDESSSSELSDAPSVADDSDQEPSNDIATDNDTSSELSSVIDEPVMPRKKSKPEGSGSKPSAKSNKPSKSKSKPAPESDPNTEEIKRLQGWLVKCGIRKVWGKELKPFETPKAKIAHLKSMLSEAGMTGRYSNEKAAQIKEARELAADIEAVQEGNERWGKDSGDEDEDEGKGRPKRRLIRGAQNYDFLSSDGEETD